MIIARAMKATLSKRIEPIPSAISRSTSTRGIGCSFPRARLRPYTSSSTILSCETHWKTWSFRSLRKRLPNNSCSVYILAALNLHCKGNHKIVLYDAINDKTAASYQQITRGCFIVPYRLPSVHIVSLCGRRLMAKAFSLILI